MLSKRLQTTLHMKKSCSMLSYYSWNSIAYVKTSNNVVQDAIDNIAREKSCSMLSYYSWNNIAYVKTSSNVVQDAIDKILFYVAVILLRQHFTGKNPFQCCSRTPENIVEEKSQFKPTFWRFLFWTTYFFDNKWLLQMLRQHCTNFRTLHKKNPALTLNKKTRLYGRVSTTPCIWRGFILFQSSNCSLK